MGEEEGLIFLKRVLDKKWGKREKWEKKDEKKAVPATSARKDALKLGGDEGTPADEVDEAVNITPKAEKKKKAKRQN